MNENRKGEGSGKVYLHVMQGSRYIFSDERNKRKFLDIITKMVERGGWCIYAFCIMDEQAYFVIEASCRERIRAEMHKAEALYVWTYHQMPEAFCCIGVPFFLDAVTQELKSAEEVAAYCRFIHRIPLERGYVRRLGDYWWSSYVTYAGYYDWRIVECRVLLSCFSTDEEKARRKLQQYHKRNRREYGGQIKDDIKRDMTEKLCFS